MKQSGYQSRLAEKTGYSAGYISLILSGERDVNRMETSKRLSNAIGRADTFFLKASPEEMRYAVEKFFNRRG